MALMAASVLRYMYFVSPPRFDGVSDIFAKLFCDCSVLSCVVGVDSMISASSGKRSSRFASHSRTSLVRGSVKKEGWRRASCVKGRRNNPPVRLSYFFRILTSPVEAIKDMISEIDENLMI